MSIEQEQPVTQIRQLLTRFEELVALASAQQDCLEAMLSELPETLSAL